jgi:hypothetical protein
MVFLDDFEDNQKANKKKDAELTDSIVFNDGEE